MAYCRRLPDICVRSNGDSRSFDHEEFLLSQTAPEFEFKQVIAVRMDLGMSRGKMAVQVAHASVTASEETRTRHRSWWKTWMDEGQCKVAVKVHSEIDLFDLEEKADKLDLPTAIIRDRGLTEIPPGTITCFAVGPGPYQIVDKVTGSLPLL